MHNNCNSSDNLRFRPQRVERKCPQLFSVRQHICGHKNKNKKQLFWSFPVASEFRQSKVQSRSSDIVSMVYSVSVSLHTGRNLSADLAMQGAPATSFYVTVHRLARRTGLPPEFRYCLPQFQRYKYFRFGRPYCYFRLSVVVEIIHEHCL